MLNLSVRISGSYTYPCDFAGTIALTFAGASGDFPINLADFNLGQVSAGSSQCQGGIIGMNFNDAAGQPLAIVGDEFIKSWYSTFNCEFPDHSRLTSTSLLTCVFPADNSTAGGPSVEFAASMA